MEVASPIPFYQINTSSKRPYSCSPSIADSHGMDHDDAEMLQSRREFRGDTLHQMFKRRRCDSSESMSSAGMTLHQPSSSGMVPGLHGGVFGSSFSNCKGSVKRSRGDRDEATDFLSNGILQNVKQQEEMSCLRSELQERVAEIDHLKSEKILLMSNVSQARVELERLGNENRILKKAVTIQQERQNVAMAEIEAACRYRIDAEERIRRLEHMNTTLRFQLQARDSVPSHGFMGFEPRPPDVC